MRIKSSGKDVLIPQYELPVTNNIPIVNKKKLWAIKKTSTYFSYYAN
jgi:hypothetical protein